MKVSLVKTSMEIDIVSPREESDGLYSSSAIGEWRGGGVPWRTLLASGRDLRHVAIYNRRGVRQLSARLPVTSD